MKAWKALSRAPRQITPLSPIRVHCVFNSTSASPQDVPATRIAPVSNVHGQYDQVDVEVFRRHTFEIEQPLLVSQDANSLTTKSFSLPAIQKWFSGDSENDHGPRFTYLEQYGDSLLPYELITTPGQRQQQIQAFREWLTARGQSKLADYLSNEVERPGFHSFYAPLKLLLMASSQSSSSPNHLPGLYIAQAQIIDLPKDLAADLPTPRAVLEAGRGSIYDANIWLGCPPTYTSLHKDPNPNLFVQLAGNKRVRLFTPSDGLHLFRSVQRKLGRSASASFRGEEMMFGPEKEALHEAVWGQPEIDGYEAIVQPGDALVIPKGWWHSIKSTGTEFNGSVNWWFR